MSDVEGYLAQIVEQPEFASAISVPMTAVPTSVQQAFESNPAGFLENIVTATPLPLRVTDIPAPLQSEVGSIVNEALSIIDIDLQSNISTTRVSIGFMPSHGRCGWLQRYKRWSYRNPYCIHGSCGADEDSALAGMTALMVGVWLVFHVFNIFA